jgi:DNA-directed RNA polymerase subunit RPC12/RpoP
MKAGDSFDCPHCGQGSFLKKESVMDGWRKAGEVLKCASCSATICEIKPQVAQGDASKGSSAGLSKLASILGPTPKSPSRRSPPPKPKSASAATARIW